MFSCSDDARRRARPLATNGTVGNKDTQTRVKVNPFDEDIVEGEGFPNEAVGGLDLAER